MPFAEHEAAEFGGWSELWSDSGFPCGRLKLSFGNCGDQLIESVIRDAHVDEDVESCPHKSRGFYF